jgi:uroporphyrinogen-III decarboxylase
VFDQTELREVKKRFTGWACFGGNVPSSLLIAGKPEEVKAHVKRLIDDVGRTVATFSRPERPWIMLLPQTCMR